MSTGNSTVDQAQAASFTSTDPHRIATWVVGRVSFLHIATAVVLASLPLATGCHVILPLDSQPVSSNYQCTMHQVPCVHVPKTVGVNITTPGFTCSNTKMHLKVGERVYCDTAVCKLQDAGPFEMFKMATVVRLPFFARKNTDESWLQMEVGHDTQAFYLAYDDRVQHKPEWLVGDFQESKDPTTGANRYITITTPDLGGPTPGPFQMPRMRIYQWKHAAPRAGETIHLPGNAHGYPAVPGNPPLQTLPMYIPFFIPEYDETSLVNCNPSDFVLFTSKVCDPNKEIAQQDLMSECNADRIAHNRFNYKCDPLTSECNDVGTCSKDQTLTSPMLSYTTSSVVRFDPAQSLATFTIQGEGSQTEQLRGGIHFEYVYNQTCDCMMQMRINDLHVAVDDMTIKGTDFTDITVTLNKVGRADCDNVATQFGKTCPSYTVPVNEFSCNFNFKQDGEKKLVLVTNPHAPAQVQINHVTRQLEIKNVTLVTQVEIDGDLKDVTIEFDLFGNFVNFAPYASGSESQVFSECQERTNKTTIHLTASTSFDPQNTVASPPALTYEWYEDYGLPTQKSLGTGMNCYIPPGAMSFGVHQITLVVRDGFGTAATDTFDVTVNDTMAPLIKAPKPVDALSLHGQAMRLYLGYPTFNDLCQSQDLWISNDAPEWFFPGFYTVRWTADDGSGNIGEAFQNVTVYELAPVPVEGFNVARATPVGAVTPHPSEGDYTVTAGGADIWDTADQFFYAYAINPDAGDQPRQIGGDFTAVVGVRAISAAGEPHAWAKAGLMLRASLDYGSPHTMIVRTPGNGVSLQGRDLPNEQSWLEAMGGGYGPNDIVWLRLDRQAGRITASYAVGGELPPTAWSATRSIETPLPSELTLGLATTSHNQGQEVTVEYVGFHLGPYCGPIVLAEPEFPSPPSGGAGRIGIREVIDNDAIFDQSACYASIASGGGTIVDYEAPVLNIHDSAGNGHFGDDRVFGVVAAEHRAHGEVDHLSLVARGVVRIPSGQGGEWTFGVNSDDGFTLQFPGYDFSQVTDGEIANFFSGAAIRWYGPRGAADTLGVIGLPSGDHPFILTFHEQGGGAAVELYAAGGVHGEFDPAVFRLVGHKGAGTIPVPGFCDEVTITASRPRAWSGGEIVNLLNAVDAIDEGPLFMDTAAFVNHSDPDDGADDPDNAGAFGADAVFPNNLAGDDNDFAVRVTGLIDVPAPGRYQIGFNSDDGVGLRIHGLEWTAIVADATGNAVIQDDRLLNNSLTGWSFTAGEIEFPHAGCYEFSALMFERSGGSFFELFGRGFSSTTGLPDPSWHLLEVGGAGTLRDGDGLQLVGPPAECLPECRPDYPEWVELGRPECWCNPRQCHGDADGQPGGSEKVGFYHVGPADLNLLISAWLVREPPHGPGITSVLDGICADFDHTAGGSSKTGFFRVGPTDLNILIGHWLVKEWPNGTGTPPDCLNCP